MTDATRTDEEICLVVIPQCSYAAVLEIHINVEYRRDRQDRENNDCTRCFLSGSHFFRLIPNRALTIAIGLSAGILKFRRGG